jgi:hypothetical protein
LGKRVTHEHGLHRLQIVLGRKIHDGEIFVVEFAVLLRGIAIALDEMLEQFAVSLDMPIEIHADETVELKKAGIDVAHETRIGKRHLGDDVAAEPIDAARLRELVHLGRILARIDRAAHQDHGMGHIGVVLGLHARDRGEDRDRGLAHREHVHIAAEHVQDRDQIVDVVVEIEASLRTPAPCGHRPIR